MVIVHPLWTPYQHDLMATGHTIVTVSMKTMQDVNWESQKVLAQMIQDRSRFNYDFAMIAGDAAYADGDQVTSSAGFKIPMRVSFTALIPGILHVVVWKNLTCGAMLVRAVICFTEQVERIWKVDASFLCILPHNVFHGRAGH